MPNQVLPKRSLVGYYDYIEDEKQLNLYEMLMNPKPFTKFKMFKNENKVFEITAVSSRYSIAYSEDMLETLVIDSDRETIATIERSGESILNNERFNKPLDIIKKLEFGKLTLSKTNRVSFHDVIYKQKGEILTNERVN